MPAESKGEIRTKCNAPPSAPSPPAIDVTRHRDGGKHRPISDRTPPASAGRTTDITIFNAVAERLPSPHPIVIYFHGGGFTLFCAASRTYDALNRRPVRQPPSRPPSIGSATMYDVWAKVRPGRLLQRGLPRRRRLVMATGCPIFRQVKLNPNASASMILPRFFRPRLCAVKVA
ncbi:hypothetical protein DAI22_05g025650 [Oryza sativa Japonica Group]|nr:hypothetical protein DAI22_05g025650 [Oryza sativa Japonica Group]